MGWPSTVVPKAFPIDFDLPTTWRQSNGESRAFSSSASTVLKGSSTAELSLAAGRKGGSGSLADAVRQNAVSAHCMLPFNHLELIQKGDLRRGEPLHKRGLDQLRFSCLDGPFLWALRAAGFTNRFAGTVVVPFGTVGWLYIASQLVSQWCMSWTISALMPVLTALITIVYSRNWVEELTSDLHEPSGNSGCVYYRSRALTKFLSDTAVLHRGSARRPLPSVGRSSQYFSLGS